MATRLEELYLVEINVAIPPVLIAVMSALTIAGIIASIQHIYVSLVRSRIIAVARDGI